MHKDNSEQWSSAKSFNLLFVRYMHKKTVTIQTTKAKAMIPKFYCLKNIHAKFNFYRNTIFHSQVVKIKTNTVRNKQTFLTQK